MDAVHEEEYKGYKIEIHHDECEESPREWDNICIFHIRHRRCSFGDVNHPDIESIMQAKKEAEARGDIVLLLYMYSHSGITISLTPFQCRWDSCQVGFVVIPRLKMLEEFKGKYFAKKLKAKGMKHAEAEVKTLDQFLRGEVYGYKIAGSVEKCEKCDNEEREDLDSCWGFYGKEDCLEEAKGMVDYYVEEKEKECSPVTT
jgi:hypothetical protein